VPVEFAAEFAEPLGARLVVARVRASEPAVPIAAGWSCATERPSEG
jgi:hypothetical protein